MLILTPITRAYFRSCNTKFVRSHHSLIVVTGFLVDTGFGLFVDYQGSISLVLLIYVLKINQIKLHYKSVLRLLYLSLFGYIPYTLVTSS